jgi:hypothetical protein
MLALGLLIATVACSSGELEVVGTVVGVEQRSLTELSSLTVRDDAGREWTFVAQGFAGMTSSHLAEHQATREMVRVTYVESDDGALVIVEIEDA